MATLLWRSRFATFATFAAIAAILSGCSSSNSNPPYADNVLDAAGPDAAACPCDPLGDSGSAPALTTLACYCGPSGCPGYDARTREFCDGPNASYFKVTESLYASCNLKVLTVAGMLSGGTSVFDATSGALLGAVWQGDVIRRCPDTQREHVGFAAGAYTVPPSCERTSQRNPCEVAPGNADAGAAD